MTVNREGPIIFSAPMILALLSRSKTQTRRTTGLEEIGRGARVVGYSKDHRGRFSVDFDDPEGDGCFAVPSPYGGPGDRLWVREGVRRTAHFASVHFESVNGAIVKNESISRDTAEYIADGAPAPIDFWGWKNKALPAIHMPRGVCRIRLQLEAVRVERLKDISEADARAEGISMTVAHVAYGRTPAESVPSFWWPGADRNFHCARDAYFAGWESLHGAASVDLNPFCWVLSFHQVPR